MCDVLTPAQITKFALLFGGLRISPDAEDFIMRQYGNRPLTLADYASTTGVTLVLEEDVWVNAPIATFNPNMVFEPQHELRVDRDRLFVLHVVSKQEVPARFAPVPAYQNQHNGHGELFTKYVHTHGDRGRLWPIKGCAMRCRFCSIPYDFRGRYYSNATVRILEAAARAIEDPIQPASHLLISGGAPAKKDHKYLQQVYRCVIAAFEGIKVDIMMAPVPEIIDLDDLERAGVNELSLNIEIWSRERSLNIMPEKHRQGRKAYMDFISKAVDRLGRGRVRSILIVGLEEPESTLDGVAALASLGCVPVLSPFRPDPVTELAKTPPPSVETMIRVFLEATNIAAKYGLELGPRCIPCSHNTLTLAHEGEYYEYQKRRPTLV